MCLRRRVVHMSTDAFGGQRCQSLGVGVTGSRDLPNMGSGNWTQTSAWTTYALNPQATSPRPKCYCFYNYIHIHSVFWSDLPPIKISFICLLPVEGKLLDLCKLTHPYQVFHLGSHPGPLICSGRGTEGLFSPAFTQQQLLSQEWNVCSYFFLKSAELQAFNQYNVSDDFPTRVTNGACLIGNRGSSLFLSSLHHIKYCEKLDFFLYCGLLPTVLQ